MGSLLAFLAAIPISVVVGIRLCGKFSSIQNLAGWLTLKPFLAIPLWSMMMNVVEPVGANRLAYLWTALPGVGLTLFLVLCFRTTIFAWDKDARISWLLLLLDTVRWGSTLLAIFLPRDSGGDIFLFSLTMPLIFAFVALATCETRY